MKIINKEIYDGLNNIELEIKIPINEEIIIDDYQYDVISEEDAREELPCSNCEIRDYENYGKVSGGKTEISCTIKDEDCSVVAELDIIINYTYKFSNEYHRSDRFSECELVAEISTVLNKCYKCKESIDSYNLDYVENVYNDYLTIDGLSMMCVDCVDCMDKND